MRPLRLLFATFLSAAFAGAAPAHEPGSGAANVPALIADVAGHELCPRVQGRFFALQSDGEQGPVTGRLWVQSCRAEKTADGLRLALGGTGWRWVERARERLGARFEVDDTVRFEFRVDARAAPDFTYDPSRHVATLRLSPTQAPDVSIGVVGQPEVEAQGAWGDLLGTLASAVGAGPDSQAEQSFREEARGKFRRSLRNGISAGYDLCTGRVVGAMGRLEPGDLGDPKLAPAPPDWTSSAEVRLHGRTLDVAGPFDASDEPLHAKVEVTEGTLHAALVCAEDAHALARRLVETGAAPALSSPRAEERIAAGATRTLTVEKRPCPLALVGLPADGASGSVAYRFVVYGDGKPDPIVSCTGERAARVPAPARAPARPAATERASS